MKVRVASLATAEELAKDWADRVVSLVGPNVELPNFRTWHHIIRCNDVESVTDMWAPRLDDVRLGFDFCQPADNVLVHCEGGISRSTAFSIGLLVRDGLSIPDAVEDVHQQSLRMGPNSLILQHCDVILQLDGLLVSQVNTIVSAYPKDMTLWCAECKVHFLDGQNCPGKHWLPAPNEDV